MAQIHPALGCEVVVRNVILRENISRESINVNMDGQEKLGVFLDGACVGPGVVRNNWEYYHDNLNHFVGVTEGALRLVHRVTFWYDLAPKRWTIENEKTEPWNCSL